MAQFEKLLVVLFLYVVASSTVLVDATLSESMYITFGYQHASMQGDDLKLVLDKTTGKLCTCIQFRLSSHIYLS